MVLLAIQPIFYRAPTTRAHRRNQSVLLEHRPVFRRLEIEPLKPEFGGEPALIFKCNAAAEHASADGLFQSSEVGLQPERCRGIGIGGARRRLLRCARYGSDHSRRWKELSACHLI